MTDSTKNPGTPPIPGGQTPQPEPDWTGGPSLAGHIPLSIGKFDPRKGTMPFYRKQSPRPGAVFPGTPTRPLD